MSYFPSSVSPQGGGADRRPLVEGDEAYVVERAALMQVAKRLEQECQRQEEIWSQLDLEFAQVMGGPGVQYQTVGTKIERVMPENFFLGARPSLLMSSIDFWPSVTSRCTVVGPSPAREQGDQFDVLDCQLSLEVLCKAGPVAFDDLHKQPGIDAEGEANRQIQLLSAAVHMCIRRDPTLGGRVQPPKQPPNKTTGLPTAVAGNSRERSGPYNIYIGRRLRYTFQLNSY